ncbi:universal stress protein [Carnobacterium sp. ISL-102]|uniref:universal stress protein n=1 Tax=Carnobacterium TaxID=2747 RepID=UPI001BE76B93|nr:universal stress protein [Carnobacterium sp. ISL-102]MBT2731747.1 universal stress protein [Carnobacterium sp. ISL-102]
MKKIVIAYDGTSEGVIVFDYIKQNFLSHFPTLQIDVIRVISDNEVLEDAMNFTTKMEDRKAHHQSVVQSFVEHKLEGVPVSVKVLYGDPTKKILSYLEKNQPFDFLVVGMNTKGGLYEFFNGSVTIQLLKHSKYPILIVK